MTRAGEPEPGTEGPPIGRTARRGQARACQKGPHTDYFDGFLFICKSGQSRAAAYPEVLSE